MTQPDPTPTRVVATITGTDLLTKLDALTAAVSNVDRKVDPLPAAIVDIRSDVSDHEGRLRNLERRIWVATGGSAVVGAVIGWVLQVVTTR